jgi:hypothetical protein
LAAKVQWAADSTKRPGIARVSYPLESPVSEVYETTFRIPIAGRERAGGRFLVAVVKFHHVTLEFFKRLSPQISENLPKLGPYLLAKTRGTDHPHSKKFPTSTFWPP